MKKEKEEEYKNFLRKRKIELFLEGLKEEDQKEFFIILSSILLEKNYNLNDFQDDISAYRFAIDFCKKYPELI